MISILKILNELEINNPTIKIQDISDLKSSLIELDNYNIIIEIWALYFKFDLSLMQSLSSQLKYLPKNSISQFYKELKQIKEKYT